MIARRWWLSVWDDGVARAVYNRKPNDRPTRIVETVEVVPADQLAGAVSLLERAGVALNDHEPGSALVLEIAACVEGSR